MVRPTSGRLRTLLPAPLLASVSAAMVALLLVPMGAHADTQTRSVSFEYDASSGLLTRETVEPDTPNNCLQTTYSYDPVGNKQSVSTATCAGASGTATWSATAARTANSTYYSQVVTIDGQTYNTPAGTFPTYSANALGQSEYKSHDPRFGALIQLTGPNALNTYWSYDGFGRKTRETRADATYTTWAYRLCTDAGASCPGPIGGAAIAWVAIEQSYSTTGVASAPEKRIFYDTLSRPVRSQTQGFDGAGVAPVLVQDTQYNALGQVWKKSSTYAVGATAYWTTYTYDVLGRVTREESPDPANTGGVAITTMDYNGLVSTVTNSKSQTKTTLQNAQGQVAQVTDAQGNTTSYTYDALGQLTQTNAAGSITQLSYNQRGQKTAMVDPAMGAWQYAYNVFGELVWQRDSLSQATTMTYDVLGRMTQRTETDLTSNWYYDKKADTTSCGKGIGKLCEAKSNNGYDRIHTYDSLGRASSTATVLDNPLAPATVSVSFEASTGRLATRTWPTGYQAGYQYSALGYLKKVTGGGTGGFTQTVSVEIQAMNALGQITQVLQGNQVTTVRSIDPATGRLRSQSATLAGQATGNVLNHGYTYDSLGNLSGRSDDSPGVGTQEIFGYDTLNRLTLSTIVGGSVSAVAGTEVMYDARGNVTYKSDVGRYFYDPARPNRMTNVTLETAPGATYPLTGTRVLTYAFDDTKTGAQNVGGTTFGNGNLWYTVSQDTVNARHNVRWETYTSFNMPAQLLFGSLLDVGEPTNTVADRTLTFAYGPEHQRIQQQVQLSTNGTSAYSAGTTWYLNGEDGQGLSFEREIKTSGLTENRHYVSAGGLVFSLFVSRTGTLGTQSATTTRYFHHDQLGSIAAISDTAGAVVERLAYDPWGKRRFINTTPGLPDNLDAIVGVSTDRGYTMHEHLDEMGVIHMNGRIYDPLIGRFMSADPFIQSPGHLQSYNRYAYVMNNPLAFTDPSGFSAWTRFRDRVLKPAAAIVVAIYAPELISSVFGAASAGASTAFGSWAVSGTGATFQLSALGSVVSGAASGFAAGAVSSGNLQGALQGGLTGGLFGAAGSLTEGFSAGSLEKIASHAGAGCISGAVGGSGCGTGALSAGFAEMAGPALGDWGRGAGNTTKYAILGGVGSVLGGGKFENGAVTGAFGYLFNELLHEQNGRYLSGYETRDSKSNDRIWKLDPSGVDPSIKLDVVTALNASEAYGGGSLRVAQGYRTSAEQDALYAQGRTTPGSIVTWARGGESIHNLGLAVDVFRVDGRNLFAPSPTTVETFKRYGFSWGGDWAAPKTDRPHFQR